MFERLQPVPPDPILGLTDAFNQDQNPHKVNLGVGIFVDADGRTPTLGSVRTARTRYVELDAPMTYLPIVGSPVYGKLVAELVLGRDAAPIAAGRTRTAHTPGGTGALRVAADFIAAQSPRPTVWICDPTWVNHLAIFRAAGLSIKTYPYYDPKTMGLDFDAMVSALSSTGPNDVVLMHACCHNPTGIDPSPEQWKKLAALQAERGFMPFFDFAYQGLGTGLESDALGVRTFMAEAKEMLVASSFSKNFGLYNQRTGALTFVARSAEAAAAGGGHLARSIRANYSNPPAYGAALAATVLGDPALRAQWEAEVTAMREHIHTARNALLAGLSAAGANRDFSFLTRQRGMFSFTGLTDPQVVALRERYGIYMVAGGGRINVAAVSAKNVQYIAKSIADVLQTA